MVSICEGFPSGQIHHATLSALHHFGLGHENGLEAIESNRVCRSLHRQECSLHREVTELKVGNFLKDVFGLNWGDFKAQVDEEHQELIADCAKILPELDTATVQASISMWFPFLSPKAKGIVTEAAASDAGSSKILPAPELNQFNASHVKWVCGHTGEKKIKRSYVKNRIPGIAEEKVPWVVLRWWVVMAVADLAWEWLMNGWLM